MPLAPRKPCAERHCPNLVEAGVDRCTAHARLHPRASTDHLRGRSGWDRQRRVQAFLAGKTCLDAELGDCDGRLEADHVIELIDGGSDHESNWAPRCRLHHRRKTAAAARARGAGEKSSRRVQRQAPAGGKIARAILGNFSP